MPCWRASLSVTSGSSASSEPSCENASSYCVATRLHVRDRGHRAKAQRDVLGVVDDRLQDRHRPRVIAGVGDLPALEIREVVLLGLRQRLDLRVELLHERHELRRLGRLQAIGLAQQLRPLPAR